MMIIIFLSLLKLIRGVKFCETYARSSMFTDQNCSEWKLIENFNLLFADEVFRRSDCESLKIHFSLFYYQNPLLPFAYCIRIKLVLCDLQPC